MDPNHVPSSSSAHPHTDKYARAGKQGATSKSDGAHSPITRSARGSVSGPSQQEPFSLSAKQAHVVQHPIQIKVEDTSMEDQQIKEHGNRHAWPGSQPPWLTLPMASASRLPDLVSHPPELSPLDLLPNGAIKRVHPPRLDLKAPDYRSPLLTSVPLIRTSTPIDRNNFYTVPGSSAPRIKRTVRASSLPTGDPGFNKKRRTADGALDICTPSEPREYTYRKPERGRSLRALTAARFAMPQLNPDFRFSRSIPMRPPRLQINARSEPPINLESLRTLDSREIIKNNQLRHDLLFDTLAFRPINLQAIRTSVEEGKIVTAASGAPGGEHYVQSICNVTEMYWESIAMEVATGCRCIRWEIESGIKPDNAGIKNRTLVEECLCQKWMPGKTEEQWWSSQANSGWPSRIPVLISSLREVLLSLMGSTTPCPSHFAHSFSYEALIAHERTCPTITHALVPELCKALNSETITRGARRGFFDPKLFKMLGDAMKVHCAPIRDKMVDDMVATALGDGRAGNVVEGLRKCFDCVEAMKLDIANHQVHALRPQLWKAAPEHEHASFRRLLDRTNVTLEESLTHSWIRSASQHVLVQTAPPKRTHLIGNCPCGDRTELVVRSVSRGFMQLVFHHWPVQPTWPPVSHKRMLAMNAFMVPESADKLLPESIRMDARRIKGFYADAVEIAIMHLLLNKARELMGTLWKPVAASVMKSELRVLADLLDDHIMSLRDPVNPKLGPSDIALQMASFLFATTHAKLQPDVDDKKRIRAYHDVISRIDEYIAKVVRADSPEIAKTIQQIESTLEIFCTNALFQSATAIDSNDIKLDGRCSRDAASVDSDDDDSMSSDVDEVSVMLSRSRASTASASLQADRHRREAWIASHREQEDLLIKRAGFQAVSHMFDDLTKRIHKVVSFHATVFGDMYANEGMMVGQKRMA